MKVPIGPSRIDGCPFKFTNLARRRSRVQSSVMNQGTKSIGLNPWEKTSSVFHRSSGRLDRVGDVDGMAGQLGPVRRSLVYDADDVLWIFHRRCN